MAVGHANYWCLTNSVGLLSHHNSAAWDDIEEMLQHLLDQYKKRGKELANEGKHFSNATRGYVLDGVDTAAKGIIPLLYCSGVLGCMLQS